MRHGHLQNLHGVGGRDEFQRIDGRRGRGIRRRLGQLLDQRFDLFVFFGRGPSHDLSGLDALRELGLGERTGQEGKQVCRSGGIHSLQRVDHGG